MNIKIIEGRFAICKVVDYSQVNLENEFIFLCKTDEENSLVCREEIVPANTIECVRGWKGFRIDDVLDFSLIGVLSKISAALAENNIGLFVASTFNTDYVFVNEEDFDRAVELVGNIE